MSRRVVYACDEPGCRATIKADPETAAFIGWSIELGGVYCPAHAEFEVA